MEHSPADPAHQGSPFIEATPSQLATARRLVVDSGLTPERLRQLFPPPPPSPVKPAEGKYQPHSANRPASCPFCGRYFT